MKDLLKYFEPSSGGNSQNVYKPTNRTITAYYRAMSILFKPKKIVFTPRTEEDDKRAEMLGDIMKYHLEND